MAEPPAKHPRLATEEATAAAKEASAAASVPRENTYEEREAAQKKRVGRPEGWSAGMEGGGQTEGRRYIPVGAVICPARQVQLVRKALEKLDWMKMTGQVRCSHCQSAAYRATG